MRFASNPRVYIYSVAALFVCVWLWYQQRQMVHRTASQNPPPTPAATAEVIRQSPVDKPAEMSDQSDPALKLYLVGTENQFPYVNELRSRLAGKCSVLLISGADETLRAFFKVDSVPVALLYRDGTELERKVSPLTLDSLSAMSVEHLQ